MNENVESLSVADLDHLLYTFLVNIRRQNGENKLHKPFKTRIINRKRKIRKTSCYVLMVI